MSNRKTIRAACPALENTLIFSMWCLAEVILHLTHTAFQNKPEFLKVMIPKAASITIQS